MENNVWKILGKSKYTKDGQIKIEQLYDAIERICGASKNKDIKTLSDGINETLYEVMDILDELK